MKKVESKNTRDAFLKNAFSRKHDFIRIQLPALPCTMNPVNVSVTSHLERIYKGKGIDKILYLCEDRGEKSIWYLDRDEYRKKGDKVFHDEKILQRVIRDAKAHSKKLNKILFHLEKNGIQEANLEKEYVRFMQCYIHQFSIYYAMTGPITNGEYGDVIIENMLSKYCSSKQIQEAIRAYCRPARNFMFEEKEDLKKILQKIIHQHRRNITLRNLQDTYKDIYGKLAKHQKKYYWISNNYKYARYLDTRYFFNRLKKIDAAKKASPIKKSQKNINKGIQKSDTRLLKKLGIIMGLHDERKRLNMMSHYWNFEFLKAIAKKMGAPYELLKFASFGEVKNLLTEGEINVVQLAQRRKGCINVNFKDGKEYWLTGSDYTSLKKEVLEPEKHEGRVIRGITANRGRVTGRAVVVLNVKKEGKKIRRGDILITSMTRPEFLPYLELVKAIVTDEGGITSHAAIISREMSLPCIIGTKIATKVLKDGDLVEVDAEKGIVRKL